MLELIQGIWEDFCHFGKEEEEEKKREGNQKKEEEEAWSNVALNMETIWTKSSFICLSGLEPIQLPREP